MPRQEIYCRLLVASSREHSLLSVFRRKAKGFVGENAGAFARVPKDKYRAR